MSDLVNCGGCRRHIRRTEATCPFCGIVVTSDVAGAPERLWPSVRLSRAALMVFATTVGTTACSGKVSSEAGMSTDAPPGDASVGGGGSRSSTGGALGSGGRTIVPTPGTTGGAMNWAVFYGAPMIIPNTGGTTSSGGTTSASGGTASGGRTNDADAGDAGPASGAGGTGGAKGTGVGGTGGIFAAAIYGAPPPGK